MGTMSKHIHLFIPRLFLGHLFAPGVVLGTSTCVDEVSLVSIFLSDLHPTPSYKIQFLHEFYARMR
jgi:hypothetical protein